MKKACVTTTMILTLAFAGCGGTGALSSEDVTDNEVMSVALTDGDALLVSEAEISDGMNASIANAVSQKVQSALEEQLANGEIDEDLLENGEDVEIDTSKDITAGFTLKKGFFVNMTDERVAFAGGELRLDGDLNVRIKYKGSSELALVLSGIVSADLTGVEQAGDIKGIPYSLTLAGGNDLEVSGEFAVKIKWFKITSMSANLRTAIIGSNVVATGSIADRSVVGRVDMVDVAMNLLNNDLLKQPKNFTISCSGEISTTINDQEFELCQISPTCNACMK